MRINKYLQTLVFVAASPLFFSTAQAAYEFDEKLDAWTYLEDGVNGVIDKTARDLQQEIKNAADGVVKEVEFTKSEILNLLTDVEQSKYIEIRVVDGVEIILFKDVIEDAIGQAGQESFEYLKDSYGNDVELELAALINELNTLQAELNRLGYRLRDEAGEVRSDIFEIYKYIQNKKDVAESVYKSLELRANQEVEALKDAILNSGGDACSTLDYDYLKDKLKHWKADDSVQVYPGYNVDLKGFVEFSNVSSQVLCRVGIDLYNNEFASAVGVEINQAVKTAKNKIEWAEENVTFENISSILINRIEAKLREQGIDIAKFDPSKYRVNECPLIDYDQMKSKVTNFSEDYKVSFNFDDSMSIEEFIGYFNDTSNTLCTVGIDLTDLLPKAIFDDLKADINNQLTWANSISLEDLERALKSTIDDKIDELGIDPAIFNPSSYPVVKDIEELADEYSDVIAAIEAGDSQEAVYLLANKLLDEKIKLGIKVPSLPEVPSLPSLDMPQVPDDMELTKEKSWSGFNLGSTSTVGTSANANYKLFTSERSLFAKADGNAFIHLFGKGHEVLRAEGTAQIVQSGYDINYGVAYLGYTIDDVNAKKETGSTDAHFSKIVTSLSDANPEKGITHANPLGNVGFKVKSGFKFAIGPIPVNLEFGASGRLRLDYEIGLMPMRLSAKAVPSTSFNGYGDVSAGLKGFVEVGVRGSVVIINASIPLSGVAEIKFAKNGRPYISNDIDTDAKIEAMKGKISAYVKYVVPRWGIKPWKTKKASSEIFGWKGVAFLKNVMNWGMDYGRGRVTLRGDLLDQLDQAQFESIKALDDALNSVNDIKVQLTMEVENLGNLLADKLNKELLTLSQNTTVFNTAFNQVYKSSVDRRIATISDQLKNFAAKIFSASIASALSSFDLAFPDEFAGSESSYEKELRLQLVNLVNGQWKLATNTGKLFEIKKSDLTHGSMKLEGDYEWVGADGVQQLSIGLGGLMRLSDGMDVDVRLFDMKEVLNCRRAVASVFNISDAQLNAKQYDYLLNSAVCQGDGVNGADGVDLAKSTAAFAGKKCEVSGNFEYCDKTDVQLNLMGLNANGDGYSYNVNLKQDKLLRSITEEDEWVPISVDSVLIFIKAGVNKFGVWVNNGTHNKAGATSDSFSFEFSGLNNSRAISLGCSKFQLSEQLIDTVLTNEVDFDLDDRFAKYARKIFKLNSSYDSSLKDSRYNTLRSKCENEGLAISFENAITDIESGKVGEAIIEFTQEKTIADVLAAYSLVIQENLAEKYSSAKLFTMLSLGNKLEIGNLNTAIADTSDELYDLLLSWYSAQYPNVDMNDTISAMFSLNEVGVRIFDEAPDRADWIAFLNDNLVAIHYVENIMLMKAVYNNEKAFNDTFSSLSNAQSEFDLELKKAYYFIDAIEYIVNNNLAIAATDLVKDIEFISKEMYLAIAKTK